MPDIHDGYLTATIVGPCSVNPYEWMDHVLGPHDDIGMAGTTQTAAIMAVAARFKLSSRPLGWRVMAVTPMSERELTRLRVLIDLSDDRLTVEAAGTLLGLGRR